METEDTLRMLIDRSAGKKKGDKGQTLEKFFFTCLEAAE